MNVLVSWIGWMFKAIAYGALGLSVTAIYLLYKNQNKLIYPADLPQGSRIDVALPSDFGINDYESISLRTPDGVKITGYLLYHRSQGILANQTILFLHANAGNMGHRLPVAFQLMRVCRCNIFMLSYRGYGKSEGEPSEAGLKVDAKAALDFLKQHPDLGRTKIVVYGQSIGGAVAIDLVSKNSNDIHGLMIENTFTSLRKLIPSVLPVLRYATFLCHQIWDSENAIRDIQDSIPVLFLSGSKDELIPPFHMKMLYGILRKMRRHSSNPEAQKDCSLELVSFENGMHNDTCMQPGYFQSVQSFWDRCIARDTED